MVKWLGETALWLGGKGREKELLAWTLVDCALQEVLEPVEDHEGREVPHYWFILHIQVTQHFIQSPESDQFNDVAVNTGADEGNVACSLEVSVGYVVVLEYEVRYEELDGGL